MTKKVSLKYDYIAPDGSEIRLLPVMKGGGMCQVTLPAFGVSAAVAHKSVEEIWYFIQGHGKVWRKLENRENIKTVYPGLCLTIPPGTQFQFRNDGIEPLIFIDVTMPPWPGEEEAIKVENHWKQKEYPR